MRLAFYLLLALLLCFTLWVVLYWPRCSVDSSVPYSGAVVVEQNPPAVPQVEPSPPLPQVTTPPAPTSPRPPVVGVDDEEGVLSGEDWRNIEVVPEVSPSVDGGSGGNVQEDTPRRRRR